MHFFNMSIWNPCRSSDVSTFLLNKSDCKRSKIPESHQQNFWSTWLGGIFFSSVYLNMWCVKGVWIDTRSPPSLMIFGQNFKAHTHMCTLYARKCASAHRTTNRLFKSIQKKNYRKLNRISYAYIKWMQKRCELWSALKCAPCFQVFHVPHHWHITTRRIERPNMCWKWIHNTLNHIRNTRREDKVKEEEEKKTKHGSPLRIKSFSTTNICCVFTTYVLCCIRNVRIQIASLWFHLSHVCVHRFHISMCCMRIPHYYLQKMQMKRVLAFICWKKKQMNIKQSAHSVMECAFAVCDQWWEKNAHYVNRSANWFLLTNKYLARSFWRSFFHFFSAQFHGVVIVWFFFFTF